MRHSLFKYFSEHKRAFLDGQVLFRSLSYFRDYEDESVRTNGLENVQLFSVDRKAEKAHGPRSIFARATIWHLAT
jgi:hypothetical protein